jgi:hypothetical protein
MDEKEIRRELTMLEGEHAKALEHLKNMEQQTTEARTNVVRIEGAHGHMMNLLERSKKEKESLQKPDAPGAVPPKEPEVIVAEVVK